MRTAGLILASFDQREPGRESESFAPFLPMVPLQGSTVIKREINTLRRAGLSPIFVACGYLGGALRTHLAHKGVIFLEDGEYEAGDEDRSVRALLPGLWEQCDRVISIPVEYPLFDSRSAELLLERRKNTRAVYEGRGALRLWVPGGEAEPEELLETEDEGLALTLLEEGGRERVLSYVERSRAENALTAHVKLVLRKEEDFFGPGILRLMEKIEETGSLQAAASQMQMSYTKAWKMVNKAEKQLGFPLVVRLNGGRNGGSSHLTGEGRRFMERYRAMTADVSRMAENFFDHYFGEFQ